MIVTATANPALDCTIVADGVALGESYRIEPMRCQAGGKGINTARVLQQFGIDCLAVVIAPSSDPVTVNLVESGIAFRLVETSAPVRKSVTVVDREQADAMVFNEAGAPCSAELTSRFCAALTEATSTANVLTINGSLPPGFDQTLLADAIAIIKQRQCAVIVDSSADALWAAAQAGADLLKPNAHELAETTGESDPVRGAHALIAAGARTVLVSLGREGMLLVSQHGPTLAARLNSSVSGNPTGAGDALVAAIAAGFDRSRPETTADWSALLRQGVAWSAAAVLEPLAGRVGPQYTYFLSQVEITEMSTQ